MAAHGCERVIVELKVGCCSLEGTVLVEWCDMSQRQFPDGFFWGAATASYQVEGGIENNDWAQAARDGRVPPCGRACDHYHRYEEDFDIAQSLGHTAHRFSLEWARIEPEEGKFNEEAIEHYRQVIRACQARGMEPIVTLWHFTLPQWFAEKGGFEHRDSPQVFARYARHVAEQLGAELGRVTTMNEPIVFAGLGWLKGNWPPFTKFSLADVFKMTHSGDDEQARAQASVFAPLTYARVVDHLVAAHRQAYESIKAVAPHAQVRDRKSTRLNSSHYS